MSTRIENEQKRYTAGSVNTLILSVWLFLSVSVAVRCVVWKNVHCYWNFNNALCNKGRSVLEIGSGFAHELEVPVKVPLFVYCYSTSLLPLWVQTRSSTDVCSAMYLFYRMYICSYTSKIYICLYVSWSHICLHVSKMYRIFSNLIRTLFTVCEGWKVRCGLELRAG